MQELKNLPKIDQFVANQAFLNLNQSLVLLLSRKIIEEKRVKILNNQCVQIDKELLIKEVLEAYENILQGGIKSLINATGVIIHTNLGRSKISETIYEKAKNIICQYSNLEYNLERGERGERYSLINSFFQMLFNTEDFLVVNNNAAAVFLILNTFAKDKEVIVSRGELVEIGGSFRIPDVMKESGAKLIEVGTTNKTKIKDYENAVNENTSMLMKVHKSNFTIEGFSEEATFEEILNLSSRKKLIDYYDLGSGYIGKLPFNLSNYEANLENILKYNPSLISFSGDKLFGSVQAGIILGKKNLIEKLKKNQLLRMLRVDKITLAFIQESIKAYLANDFDLISTRKLLHVSLETLKTRASSFCQKLGSDVCGVKESYTYIGGGTFPNKKIPTIALKIHGNPKILEKSFRENLVIGRIENESFLLDFRSIDESEDSKLLSIINKVLNIK